MVMEFVVQSFSPLGGINMPDNNYQRDFNDNMLEWRGEMKAVVTTLKNRVEKIETATGMMMWFKIIAIVGTVFGIVEIFK